MHSRSVWNEMVSLYGHIWSMFHHITKINFLFNNLSFFYPPSWLWYDIGINPSSRYKLSIWQYLNSTHMFLNYEHLPVISLPTDVSKGMNMALEVLVGVMNQHETAKTMFIPPYHLYDGFMLVEHSSGVQYTLHMSLHQTGSEVPVEGIANVFLPFQGAGMATYQLAKELERKTVHLIVNVGKTSDLSQFVRMYEDVCIRNSLGTHLHVVIFGSEGNVRSQIADLVARHPREPISSYELMEGRFSHSLGYKHVSDKLLEDDLLLLLDHTFLFTSEFIWHVRMNAVKGRQAYFPILFSFYKPELVNRFLKRASQTVISADTGFFLRYNYQVVAIYKSDYDKVRGVELSSAGGVSKNDDVRFVDKALSSDIYVMRALEPYLRRNYRVRSCSSLSGSALTACMNSKADAIGSKKILGSLLISHELLDAV